MNKLTKSIIIGGIGYIVMSLLEKRGKKDRIEIPFIDVEDSLPPEDGNYLVFIQSKDGSGWCTDMVPFSNGRFRINSDDYDMNTPEITAWFPIKFEIDEQ